MIHVLTICMALVDARRHYLDEKDPINILSEKPTTAINFLGDASILVFLRAVAYYHSNDA